MKKLIYLFIGATLVFSSCSSIKVTSQFDPQADFTQYETFSYLGWSENSDQLINDFDKKRIEEAFKAEFEARNITYVEEGGDIDVSIFLVTDTKTATTAYTNYYGGYGAYGYGRPWGWGGGYATTTYQQYDYVVGTLVCDVFDGESKQLIWQSVGTGTVDENPSTRDKSIPKAVNKIMSLYPIEAAK